MSRFAPKTIKGKLLLAYLAFIAIFTVAGVFMLAQLTHLRSTSEEFFGKYSQTENLIIATRFKIDEINSTVLSPPENIEPETYAGETMEIIEDVAVQFQQSILPPESRHRIAKSLVAYGEALVVPLILYEIPIEMMEEADDVALACLEQAEKVHQSGLVLAIAKIVDAYTDILLTNEQYERKAFDELVEYVEKHPSYSAISSFPLLKQKALAVFKTNENYVQALSYFKNASSSLVDNLAETEKKFYEMVLIPGQRHLTDHVQQVAWIVFVVMVFSIVLATLISLILGRKIWRPLTEMGDMVDRMTRGDLNHRLFIRGEDEVATIGISLNLFADQLKNTLEQLDNQMAEQALVETELRKSEIYNRDLSREYQVVLDGISESLVVVNQERNIVWSNKKASDEFFSEIDQKVEKQNYNLDEGSSYYLGSEHVDLCFDTEEKVEDLIQTQNMKYYRIRVFPLKNAAGEIDRVLRMLNDITEQYRLREEAELSSRLASLGELSAGVAHEINNPNSLVVINSPIIRDAFEDIMPILENHYKEHGDFQLGGLSYLRIRYDIPLMLKEMHEGGMRIQHIIDDLKNFVSTGRAVDGDLFKLNVAVEAAVRMTHNAIKKATDNFTINLDSEVPAVKGNIIQLEQVVVNLVQNACLALPDRSRGLTVTTNLSDDNKYVLLIVRDEGVGIAAELLQRITEPFFTTRRQDGGTGLGLSVSNRIVQDHGGQIFFKSKPGEWTEVTVQLPIADSGDN